MSRVEPSPAVEEPALRVRNCSDMQRLEKLYESGTSVGMGNAVAARNYVTSYAAVPGTGTRSTREVVVR